MMHYLVLVVVLVATVEAGATGPTCVSDCSEVPTGYYQSCKGCNVYLTCDNGRMFDERPCAPSPNTGGLFWDDNYKTCAWESSTCSFPITTVIGCERNSRHPNVFDLKLECPKGETIKIVDANYGRSLPDHVLCQYHAAHKNDFHCESKTNTMALVSAACDGKESCSLAPSNAVFADPCVGTYKYLEVDFMCRGKSRKVHATCDNIMSFYVDGVAQSAPASELNNWKVTSAFDLADGAKVIGIKCKDTGVIGGILASGDGLVTDDSWRCSDEYHVGWAKPGFSGADNWEAATQIANNGKGKWGKIDKISTDAFWIWTDEYIYTGDKTVYCRLKLKDGGDDGEKPPCRTGATCINSCEGMPDGDYQSCDTCHGYHSCVAGRIMYRNRPCAPSDPPLVWDDNMKRCEWESKTCTEPPADCGGSGGNTGPTCIKSCKSRADGDYQSCDACNVYHSCVAGGMYSNRPCPANLVWDDTPGLKRCEWSSPTCTTP